MAEYNIRNTVSADEVRRFRGELRLTQKEFADLLGVSKSTVERIEKEEQETAGPVAVLVNLLLDNMNILENRVIPEKSLPLRMWYMYKNRKCTLIDVDEIRRTVKIKNYEKNILYLAFGSNNEPTYEDYEEFLKSRCFPETRDKMKIQLEALNIPFYDPMMIIEKTEGRMAEDDFWIYIEKRI